MQMNRQRSAGNGKHSPGHVANVGQNHNTGSSQSPNFPGGGMRTHHVQVQPKFQVQGNIPMQSMGVGGEMYPSNSGYYVNQHSPTLLSPPPGFSIPNSSGGLGGAPPGYQHMAMHNNLQNVLPQQQYAQNYYPVGPGFPLQHEQFEQGHVFPNGGYMNTNSRTEGNPHLTSTSVRNSEPTDYQFGTLLGNEGLFNLNNNVSLGSLARDSSNHLNNNVKFSTSSASETFEEKSQPQKDRIKPMIDNIVGSMMGNGTYTHFGPSGGIKPIPISSADFNKSNEFGTNLCGGSGFSSIASMKPLDNNAVRNDQKDARKESPILGHSTTGGLSQAVRASTPNDVADNVSRPQTPNKPSYSEILAKSKSASQNGQVAKSSRGTAPTPNNVQSTTSKSSLGKDKDSSKNPRKSDQASSGSSANSSSCTSSSSSPVAKPKTLSQTIMGRLFTTSTFAGKENSSVTINKTPSRTPSTTPTHQRKNTTGGHKAEDRKILSSQNTENFKPKSKLSKFSSSTQDFSELNVDEVENADESGSVGWTTCSRGSKHTNRPSSIVTAVASKFSNCDTIEDNGSTGSPKISEGNEMKRATPTPSIDDEQSGKDKETDWVSRRESLTEKRGAPVPQTTSVPTASTSTGGVSTSRKSKEKDRSKSKKDDRNCAIRRFERLMYLWAASLISAMAWLLKLVTDVFTLSISVGSTLIEDLYTWWLNKAVPTIHQKVQVIEETIRSSGRKLKQSLSWKKWPFRRKVEEDDGEFKKNSADLLAALGPEKSIQIINADETLKRLLSCKGQDPYTILGVKSDSSDETIRRYYKKQAVLVHPDKNLVVGAEEAFKILGKAFEMIGEPSKRREYHNKLIEAHAKEQVYGEIGKLLEQLRKKMEIATSSIRCTKCNLRHKKNKTDRPLFAARYCAQCNIHHGAREGELWAESRGWFGMSWNYFTCMDCHIWEINEWAKCQKKNLLHIKADSHCVMYRLVAGGGNGGQQSPGGGAQDGQFHADPEDDWDSLINNLCKTGGVPGSKGGDHFYQQGSSSGSNLFTGQGGNNSTTANGSAAGRKRKGKRK